MATSIETDDADAYKRCAHCLHKAKGACATCGSVYYCSPECHWLDMALGQDALHGHGLGGHSVQAHLDQCVAFGIATVNETGASMPPPSTPNAFYRRLKQENDAIGNVDKISLLFKALGRAIDMYHTTLSLEILKKLEESIKRQVSSKFANDADVSAEVDAPAVVRETITQLQTKEWFSAASTTGFTHAAAAANAYIGRFLANLGQSGLPMDDDQFKGFNDMQALYHIFDRVFHRMSGVDLVAQRTQTRLADMFSAPLEVLRVMSSAMQLFRTVHERVNAPSGLTVIAQLTSNSTFLASFTALFGPHFASVLAQELAEGGANDAMGFFFTTDARGEFASTAQGRDVLVLLANMVRGKNLDAFLSRALMALFAVAIMNYIERPAPGPNADYMTPLLNGFGRMFKDLSQYSERILDDLYQKFSDDDMIKVGEINANLGARGEEALYSVTVDYIVARIKDAAAASGGGGADILKTVDIYARLLPLYIQTVGPAAVPQYAYALFEKLADAGDTDLVKAFIPGIVRIGKDETARALFDDEYLWAMLRVVLGNSGALLGKIQQISSEQINALVPEVGAKLFGGGKLKYPSMAPLELYRVAEFLGIDNTTVLANYDYKRTISATVGNIVMLRQSDDVKVPGILNNYEDLIIKFAKPRTLLLLAREGLFLKAASAYFKQVTSEGGGFKSAKEAGMVKKIAETAEQFLLKEYMDLFTEFNFSVELENTRAFADIYTLAWPIATDFTKQVAARLNAFKKDLGPFLHVGNTEVEPPDLYANFDKAAKNNSRRMLTQMMTYGQSLALGESLETIVDIKERVRKAGNAQLLDERERNILRMTEDDAAFKIAVVQTYWEWIAKLFDREANPQGLFHSDLHPGNIFYYNGLALPLIHKMESKTGKRATQRYIDPNIYVTFIDYGKVGRLNEMLRDNAARILFCIVSIFQHAGARDFERRQAYNEAVEAFTMIVVEMLLGPEPDLTNEQVRRIFEAVTALFQSAFYFSSGGNGEIGPQIADVLNQITHYATELKAPFEKAERVFAEKENALKEVTKQLRESRARFADLDRKLTRARKEQPPPEVKITDLARRLNRERKIAKKLETRLTSKKNDMDAYRTNRANATFLGVRERVAIVDDMVTLIRGLMALTGSLTAVFVRGLGLSATQAYEDLFAISALPIGVTWKTFGSGKLRGPLIRAGIDLAIKDTSTKTLFMNMGQIATAANAATVPAKGLISAMTHALALVENLPAPALAVATALAALSALGVGYVFFKTLVKPPVVYSSVASVVLIRMDGDMSVVDQQALPIEWDPSNERRFSSKYKGKGLAAVFIRKWKLAQHNQKKDEPSDSRFFNFFRKADKRDDVVSDESDTEDE